MVRVSIEAKAVTKNVLQQCLACRHSPGRVADNQGVLQPCGWCNGTGKVVRPSKSVLDHIILVDRP